MASFLSWISVLTLVCQLLETITSISSSSFELSLKEQKSLFNAFQKVFSRLKLLFTIPVNTAFADTGKIENHWNVNFEEKQINFDQ